MTGHLQYLLYLSIFIFCIGLAIIVMKRNTIMMLIGIELLLNACNLNLVSFNTQYASQIDGQMFALFVIIVAVSETAVGLAIIMQVYRLHNTSIPDQVNELKD